MAFFAVFLVDFLEAFFEVFLAAFLVVFFDDFLAAFFAAGPPVAASFARRSDSS